MSETFFEKIDVFLPGQGEELAQAPAHHWERAQNAPAPKSTTAHASRNLSSSI